MSASYEESTLDDLLAEDMTDVMDEPVEVVKEIVVEATPKRVRKQPEAVVVEPEIEQASTRNEIDVIAALPEGPLTLSSGMQVELEPLKARQFFRMLKIITRGAGPLLLEYPLDLQDEESLVVRLTALVAMSIPEAEDEAIDFIKSMCRPVGLEQSGDKAAQVRNVERWDAMNAELSNPEIDDLLLIITAIVQREAPDLKALGKRLKTLLAVARQTGQIPQS